MPVNYSIQSAPSSSSDAFREMLTKQPALLLRIGPVICLGALLLILGISWLVKYPDVVTGSARITSENGPREIKMVISARIQEIWGHENVSVHQGEPIAILESTAHVPSVLNLHQQLDSVAEWLAKAKFGHVQSFVKQTDQLNLGELQEAWYRFHAQWVQLSMHLTGGYLAQRQVLVKTYHQLLKHQRQHLNRQTTIAFQDTQLANKDFAAETILKEQQVISPFEYRAAQSRLFNKQQALLQWEATLLNNDIQQHENHKEMVELEGQKKQQWLVLMAEVRQLQSQIEKWMQTYVLRAPVSGKLYFTRQILPGEWLQTGESICRITPPYNSFIASLYVPQAGFGLVDTGQRVQLLLDAYPAQQFGRLNGTIIHIANVPSDSGYFARISLPDTLRTQSGYQIQYREGLLAKAHIITRDRRLLERFYRQLAELFEQ